MSLWDIFFCCQLVGRADTKISYIWEKWRAVPFCRRVAIRHRGQGKVREMVDWVMIFITSQQKHGYIQLYRSREGQRISVSNEGANVTRVENATGDADVTRSIENTGYASGVLIKARLQQISWKTRKNEVSET